MLKHLHIQNFALIQELNIQFHKGLSVLTGETGAGKSIILGALNMMLGQRADASVVLDKSKKCVIEGTFDVLDYDLESFFSSNDLDFEPMALIRREIAPGGKSRAFINDTPVTLDLLREFTKSLIDIHSQHENILLGDAKFQLQLVDGIARNQSLLSTYKSAFNHWSETKRELALVEEQAIKAASDKEFIQFQFDQLNAAVLNNPDEQQLLEDELESLTHAEEIKLALTTLSGIIDEDENSVLQKLRDARVAAQRAARFLHTAAAFEQRIESCLIELRDIADEAAQKATSIDYSPERIETITARVNLLNELQHKHRVNSLEALLLLRDEMNEKLLNIQSFDVQITGLKEKLLEAQQNMVIAGEALSKSRKSVLDQTGNACMQLLGELGMENAVFEIQLHNANHYTPNGFDVVDFLFSSNRKFAPQSLDKVASGGEKSRLMLALKSLQSTGRSLPTIILDEIDTGISGGIASKMGRIMQRMGASMQVIAITHLPQIAACGQWHYKVYKTGGEHPVSNIRLLEKEERVNEIASLLSSENITDVALNNARELLQIL